MNAHEMVWTFDRDSTTAELACNDPNCEYRYSCDKGCESIFGVEAHEGGFRHPVTEYEGGRVGFWHAMTLGKECNFALWINESGCAVELSADRHAKFEIGRVPVEPVWQGDDGAEWRAVRS